MTTQREAITEAIPRWYSIAASELGVHEVPGSGNEKRILLYHQATSLKATSDAVPWCSAFMCFCMSKAGIANPQSAAARDWLKWGQPIQLPRLGAVCVFDRSDANNPNAAHVALYIRHTDDKTLHVIGGNQALVKGAPSDRVCATDIAMSKLIGVRWPVGEP